MRRQPSARLLLDQLDADKFLQVLDNCVQLCDTVVRDETREILRSPVNSLCTYALGEKRFALAACENRTLSVVDLSKSPICLLQKIDLPAIADSVVLLHNGPEPRFAVGCSDGRVRIFALTPSNMIRPLSESADCSSGIRALTTSGSMVFIGTESGAIYSLRASARLGSKTLRPQKLFTCETGVRSLAVGRVSGTTLVFVGTYGGKVEAFTLAGTLRTSVALPLSGEDAKSSNNWVRALALMRRRGRDIIIAGSEDCCVSAFSIGQRDLIMRPLWKYRTGAWIFSIDTGDVNGDGSQEILAATWDARLYILSNEGLLLWFRKMPDRVFSVRTWRHKGASQDSVLVGLNNGDLYSFRVDKNDLNYVTTVMRQLESRLKEKIDRWGLRLLEIHNVDEAIHVVNSLTRMHHATTLPINMQNYKDMLWRTFHFLLRLSGSRTVQVARVKTNNWVTALAKVEINGDRKDEIIAGTGRGELYIIRADSVHVDRHTVNPSSEVVRIIRSSHMGDPTVVVATADGRLHRFRITGRTVAEDAVTRGGRLMPFCDLVRYGMKFVAASDQRQHVRIINEWGEVACLKKLPSQPTQLLLTESPSGYLLISGLRDGKLYCHRLFDDTFDDVWVSSYKTEITALAQLNVKEILVGTEGRQLYCVDRENGGIKWWFGASGAITAIALSDAPSGNDGAGRLIFIGTLDSKIYCLDGGGDLLWMESTPDWVRSLLWIRSSDDNEYLVMGSTDRSIHLLRLNMNVDVLVKQCWDLLNDCGYECEDLFGSGPASGKGLEPNDFLLQCYGIRTLKNSKAFDEHRQKILAMAQSGYSSNERAFIAALEEIDKNLSRSDREEIVDSILRGSNVNMVVGFLRFLRGRKWLTLSKLMPHLQNLLREDDPQIRYAVLSMLRYCVTSR